LGPLEQADEIALLSLDGLRRDATDRVEDDGAIPLDVESVEGVRNEEKESIGPLMSSPSKVSLDGGENAVDELNVVRPVLLLSGDPEVLFGAA
jgi:hypothetical protein